MTSTLCVADDDVVDREWGRSGGALGDGDDTLGGHSVVIDDADGWRDDDFRGRVC